MRVRFPTKLWQRNLLASGVVIAALAVIAWTQSYAQWSAYFSTRTPAHVIAVGQSGTFDGHTWRIDSVQHLNVLPGRIAQPLPKGTVLQVITVEHAGPTIDTGCNGVITDGRDRWNSENVGGITPQTPDGVSAVCSGKPLTLFSFLLPQDVVPTALDILDGSGAIMVRLEL